MGYSNYNIDELASDVALSTRQLQRRLKDLTKLSAAGYIRMMRLERAAKLLEQDAGHVAEVAYRVGYKDVDHISKVFKQNSALRRRLIPETNTPDRGFCRFYAAKVAIHNAQPRSPGRKRAGGARLAIFVTLGRQEGAYVRQAVQECGADRPDALRHVEFQRIREGPDHPRSRAKHRPPDQS